VKVVGLAIRLLTACVVAGASVGATAAEPTLDCKIGPIDKTFGGSHWLVYSCSDGKTLVFVTAPNSPAFPFYFELSPEKLGGEGTGDKKSTDAAYTDISKLSNGDVAVLLQETRAAEHTQ